MCHLCKADRRKRDLQTAEAILKDNTGKAATKCSECGTPTSMTVDWTLYPWPDGQDLCRECNDRRHEREDYDEVAARERIKKALNPTDEAS